MASRTGLLLAIDQGTTGTTAAIYHFDTLRLLSHHSIDFTQHYPCPGWVEHDPEEIWRTTVDAIRVALKQGKFHAQQIKAIGITNQRETTVAWSKKTAKAVGRAIVWQDRRTASYCASLKRDEKFSAKIHLQTGLVLDPDFSATKMRWILKNNPAAAKLARSNDLCLGTIDSYLIFRLTAGHSFVTDHTNASRTLLYELKSGRFAPSLCKKFGIPLNSLPKIAPSAGLFGKTRNVPGLPNGIPITGCIGDQQAALLGQNCIKPGEAKITFGTGAFLLLNVGAKPAFSKDGLLTSVAFSMGNHRTFALEGSAFIAGAAVQYIRDQFKWISDASACEKFALAVPRDPHVIFVPALAGLAAPYWNPNAKGTLLGLSRGTSQSQIVRAVLESIALQNVQIFRTMQRAYRGKMQRVGVDGGASQNDMLMQFQADVFRANLTRPENIETTSKGAAIAAKMGLVPDAPTTPREASKVFAPRMTGAASDKIVDRWLQAADAVNKFYTIS